MHFSPAFPSSHHCIVSPNGRLVATLSSDGIHVRDARTLQTLNVVSLPAGASRPITTLLWAPSSTRILVGSADQIHALSALHPSDHAAILNPLSGIGKPSHTQFGSTDRDSDILVYSQQGLKLLVYDLRTSKGLEIPGPKFYQPSSAARGVSLRASGHLALLTRVSGRDLISIHSPETRQMQRSWAPETIDAHGLCWSPDGQWLLVWESPAHGWRVLLCTADGQLVRTLTGFHDPNDEDAKLRPGVRSLRFRPDGKVCAVLDHSKEVALVDTTFWRTSITLVHPSALAPSETVQVWQEQLHAASAQPSSRTFTRATHELTLPPPPADSKTSPELRTGCGLACFDASSTLIATRMESSPSTVWIWDLAASELRAVLVFHSPVSFSWHPTVQELLLITCRVDERRTLPFVWDPLMDGPRSVLSEQALSSQGKMEAHWVDWENEQPVLLLNDSQRYCFVSVGEGEAPGAWGSAEPTMLGGSVGSAGSVQGIEGDDSTMIDDTFSFKRG
ncbi:uncharacterized protein F5Z01DRAFT_57791 [Emericellopsis atlantica]|uniref:WD40 domain-containing protein n=1 Tax=Emericellopsis atlantica TaxID=2614577 RepID=A0A9P7ZMK8_9HYPO|nr:uncharacterized protein F5Z01DRAFT_57791 [Emericellopsis atlantica]KAG9254884.1 hypothetical protein F5Z01DRAFT_57791 [Emericellopsis atlantica]